MNKKPIGFGLALLAAAGLARAQMAAAPTEMYIVELTTPPAATYSGTVAGYTATRAAPGARFAPRSSAVRAYQSLLLQRQRATLAKAGASVRPVHAYTTALNGFAVRLTEEQVRNLRAQSNVASITVAETAQLVTYHTPAYLKLSGPGGLWSVLGPNASNAKGEDVIVGVIDSGVWPENASVGDKVDAATGAPVAYHQPGVPAYGPPPAGWAGVCQTGPGFTASMCGNKLIGARFYQAGFVAAGAVPSTMEYASPRDGSGHGSHTSSTAAGNAGAPALLNGVQVDVMSGMAPRARIAVYKACWQATVANRSGCNNADLLKAYEDAILDGVHVISYSISGSTTLSMSPVERAQLNATAAGIFVAAAAGNAGPANQVNHVNPWVTTVAAAADDRDFRVSVFLGNGTEMRGISSFHTTLPAAPLALAENVALAGQAGASVCAPGSLDPQQARGRIIVCDRDGTVTRLNKSAEVLRAGGVGMVLVNPQQDTTLPDEHSVPTVHLPHTFRDALRAYAGGTGAMASLALPSVPTAAISPQVAEFSSRGPNRGVAAIMKPDLAATGVQVVAGFRDPTLTQAEHDALLVGNHTPKGSASTQSGTSMATPHVAGVAALLKQLHPTWSPAAIKSALQTTTTGMKRYDGTPDTDVWGGGAGHIDPNAAARVPLVYDVAPEDYGRFLCGLGLDPGAIGSCATLGSIAATDLNLGSLSAGATPDRATLRRTLTNVSDATLVVNATAALPGWAVTVTPSQLTLPPGGRGSFVVDLVAEPTAYIGVWAMGSLTWSDGVRSVSSPLLAQLSGFASPPLVVDNRKLVSGRKVYTVTSGRFVSLNRTPGNGLYPATLTAGRALPGGTACTDFTVAAGAEVIRFQLFNVDTEGGSATDLNLQLVKGSGGVGPTVALSSGAGSDEAVSLLSPAEGVYSACVVSATVPASGATYTLSSWIVRPGAATTLRVQATPFMVAGSPASVALAWQAPLGQRYLGTVRYLDNTTPMAPLTQVLIDNK